MASSILNSVNELVQFITAFVSEEFARTNRSVHGAKISDAIRRRYPSFIYSQVGIEKLGDAIRIGEREGLIHRVRDLRHLEVVPGVEDAGSSVAIEGNDALRYVRRDIWNAFIFFQRNLRFFFDRHTAKVVDFSVDAKEQLESVERDSNRYVPMEMIPAEVQQEWMRDYLKSAQIHCADDAPIQSERWWSEFPIWLERYALDHVAGWRVFRVQAIISYVRQWAEANNIPLTAVLSASNPQSGNDSFFGQSQPHHGHKRAGIVELTKPIPADNDAERQAILNALAELTTEELIDIAVIPYRHLRKHFRPR